VIEDTQERTDAASVGVRNLAATLAASVAEYA
jgi:hypothetical protein